MKKNTLLTIGAAVAAIGSMVYFLKNIKEDITVRHLTWERDVDVEEFKEVEECGETVPEGATVTHVAEETNRVKGEIRKVICYTYIVKKWVKEGTLTTTGDADTTPYYDDQKPLPEGRRYANKREKYYIVDTNGNTWTTDYPKWCVLREGDVILTKHRRCSNYISKLEKMRFEVVG